MKRAILLRHGSTAANLARRYCGATDLPLDPASPAGAAQQLGGHLF